MIHPLIQRDFDKLLAAFPNAKIHPGGDGTVTVEIPGIEVAPKDRWSKPETSIYFHVPLGYPQAKPDCFWADADLRLVDGNQPANSNLQQIPLTDRQGVWFSWHINSWDPGRDDLKTYVQVVRRRLRDPT